MNNAGKFFLGTVAVAYAVLNIMCGIEVVSLRREVDAQRASSATNAQVKNLSDYVSGLPGRLSDSERAAVERETRIRDYLSGRIEGLSTRVDGLERWKSATEYGANKVETLWNLRDVQRGQIEDLRRDLAAVRSLYNAQGSKNESFYNSITNLERKLAELSGIPNPDPEVQGR